jgi:sulfide dehydrogenase cytochrome subunit
MQRFLPVSAHRLLFLAGLLPGAVHAEAEVVELNRGAMLSNSCAACHGTDGNSPGAIPSIGGKSAEFIQSALIEFREGKRPGTVMNRHALGYTDEEIRLIAEFFARGR